MTATTRTRKPAPRSAAAVATDVLAQHSDAVGEWDRGWLVFDEDDNPAGHAWAGEFTAIPFVSMVKPEPAGPGFRCPVCAAQFFYEDVVCPELGEHPATQVVPVAV